MSRGTVPERPGRREAALRISDLDVTYRRGRQGTPAVRGVDLEIGAGESVALVGESGSGKSSIARAVLGLLGSSADVRGTIALDGTDLLGQGARAARRLRGSRIGYVPQDPGSSLDPIMRILDQVIEPLRIHRLGDPSTYRERALQAMREAGLADAEAIGRRWPHQLSGGQRQRVLIAAAIVTEPQLIVADEPTSALDVTVQKVILDRLQRITAERGTAILLITHDLAVASTRTDRLYAMRDGRLVASGGSRETLLHPADPYTRELVDAIPGRGPQQRRAASRPVDDGAPDVLTARGVTKRFGRGADAVVAVDDVDLHLREGRSVGIVGESGSGKTTLARVILGLERADDGEIQLDGRPVARRDRGFRRRLQPVFQTPHLSFDPMRTVGWSILEPVRSLRTAEVTPAARAELLASLLADVGLSAEHGDRRPHELSGGQLQRAAIARALSVAPEVLVCDEAVSALDVSVQARILDLLARLQRERDLSLLFITHDLAVVQDLCDEVAVMRRGEVVEAGPTAQVFADPRHDYTRALLEAIPDPWSEAA